MKLKYYFISLLAACVLLSCSKDDGDGGETPVTPTETTLSILVNPSTKAEVDPQDIISDLTVLLFIGDELYKKETKTGDNVQEITDIPVKPGNMKALLLANVSKYSSSYNVGMSYGEAMKVTANLDNEVPGKLSMSSDVMDITITASKKNTLGYGAGSIQGYSNPIKLYRNVARIQLSTLILDMDDNDFGTPVSFDLKKVYVANVKSKSYLASEDKTTGSVSAPDWGAVEFTTPTETPDGFWWLGYYDVQAVTAGEFSLIMKGATKNFLCYEFKEENDWASMGLPYHDADATALGEVVLKEGKALLNNDNGKSAIGNYFYVYESKDALASAPTVLIIQGDYTYISKNTGKQETAEGVYYTIVVNDGSNKTSGVADHKGVKRNVKYELSITVKGPGSPGPDPSKRAYVGAVVTVKEWEKVGLVDNVD